MNRVAAGLKDSDAHYHEFRDILNDMRFMPAGRIQAAVGSAKNVTAFNCFVSGTIPDSYVARDNPEQSSIMHRAEQAAATMRMGGGIGYDFSTLRPEKALIRKLMSHSSGPLSFMKIFDAVCQCTASSGHRRGAQMGVLRVDHPNILSFVNAKHDQVTLKGFNISVGITNEFMTAVRLGRSFDLRFGGEVYQTVDAQWLWEAIMRSTWDWAEPGVLFIDTINLMNNLWYAETIAATNPCGEQPLPPFGACLLGSFNLVRYLAKSDTGRYTFDYDQLAQDIPHVVRALDNVVDRTSYPLPEQEAEAKNKRRMGIGVTALANAIEAMGHPYGSIDFLAEADRIERFITRHSYLASSKLAAEKGSFPLFDTEKYLAGAFIKTLDEDVRDAIERDGMRNSHVTSYAPTGTISMCADNVSSGIEPVFSYKSKRPINTPDGEVLMDLEDYGSAFLGVKGKRADEVTVDEHLAVLIGASRNVDSAVSKTINMDGKTPWETFKGVYMRAWEGGCKGCATFNKDGKRFGLIQADDTLSQAVEACTFDPATGQSTCS